MVCGGGGVFVCVCGGGGGGGRSSHFFSVLFLVINVFHISQMGVRTFFEKKLNQNFFGNL